MSLKNIQTDDLLKRWNMLIDGYLERLAKMKVDLIKIDKTRNELLLIRQELLLRNISLDVPEDKEDCPEEPQKT